MSYQVLARKWRPRSFQEIVGQSHVVRALINALERNQIHHAYLFTGTRGVGKTTLARVLAKALLCEQGIQAKPCGICTICHEIDNNRCVDLLEIDAASRTTVEETRELLENVPYAPIKARFKIYLIDEVHMFSKHSFNALLKTLEEPPDHVKFILATTDPQKIPVTVLSRCLQFNLRRLSPQEIEAHLNIILTNEKIAAEHEAIVSLARAADGSLRDGLSLLDQAIAFSNEKIYAQEIHAMLGTVRTEQVFKIMESLAAGDGEKLLAEVEAIASYTPNFKELLRELLTLLHRLVLIQQVPTSLAADDPDQSRLFNLAAQISAENLQLYYQIILTGQTDLPLAPEPRIGFEMILLRALAFRSELDNLNITELKQTSIITTPEIIPIKPKITELPQSAANAVTINKPILESIENSVEIKPLASPENWLKFIDKLDEAGFGMELLRHSTLIEWNKPNLTLSIDSDGVILRNFTAENSASTFLEKSFGTPVKLKFQLVKSNQETVAQKDKRESEERQKNAIDTMQDDPVIKQFQTRFDAVWIPGSINASIP